LITTCPATIKQGRNACSDLHTAWLRHPAVIWLQLAHVPDSRLKYQGTFPAINDWQTYNRCRLRI